MKLYKIEQARREHMKIGRIYVYCEWSGNVALYHAGVSFNWCEDCKKVLWSSLEDSNSSTNSTSSSRNSPTQRT